MQILVTGGSGYIGSHTIVDLIENGFEVVSIDNFSMSNEKILKGVEEITGKKIKNYAIDLCDFKKVEEVFNENNIVGVIHFAAYKSVGESTEKPLVYYHNNLVSLIYILKIIEQKQIKHFVFSSSCSVYGNTKALPVTELTPIESAVSPYGATKQMGEQIITDTYKIINGNSILLRYFNPVGAHASNKIGELPIGKPQNLVPAITQTAIGILPKMIVYGNDYKTKDGSCVRDYIHVCDIAHAHTLALKYLIKSEQKISAEIFNLGTGNGVTVLEAINSFEKVSGQKLNFEIGKRREGDVVEIFANNAKAIKKLGWKITNSLDEMIQTAWNWQKKISGN